MKCRDMMLLKVQGKLGVKSEAEEEALGWGRVFHLEARGCGEGTKVGGKMRF